MIRSPNRLHKAIDIASDEARPLAVRLIAYRMAIRCIWGIRCLGLVTYRQKLAELKRAGPFTNSAQRAVRDQDRQQAQATWSAMVETGGWLARASASIDELIPFDQLCDILAVNPVHRAEAREVAEQFRHTIDGLLWSGGVFEDSAHHRSGRRTRWDAGPFSVAMNFAMNDFMLNNPDAVPDPFAPGGPFYGAPRQEMAPDGTVQIRRPALTVHSQDGSIRTVERKPEVIGE